MTSCRHLSRAPITEALIDFRIPGAAVGTVEALEERIGREDFGYYRKSPILRGTFGFAIDPQSVPSASYLPAETRIIGVRYHSKDERYVAQFSLEGCTLSRLAPYESWEVLQAEMRRIWELYWAAVEPKEVGRVATRFINNLRLPLAPGEHLHRYLTQWPQFSAGLPQQISSFLQRFVIEDPASGASVILTEGLDDASPGLPLSVMLDIDVFRSTSLRCDDPRLWDTLAALRELKNRFFFSALTNEAIDLYV